MDYQLVTPNNYGILEAKLSQRHIDLLYAYIKDSAYEGYEFEGNEVVKHTKDNQWSLIDQDNTFEKEVLQPLINVYSEINGYDREKALDKTRNIYTTTLEIFGKAQEEGITTHEAALNLAKEKILQAKIKF